MLIHSKLTTMAFPNYEQVVEIVGKTVGGGAPDKVTKTESAGPCTILQGPGHRLYRLSCGGFMRLYDEPAKKWNLQVAGSDETDLHKSNLTQPF